MLCNILSLTKYDIFFISISFSNYGYKTKSNPQLFVYIIYQNVNIFCETFDIVQSCKVRVL